MLSTDFAFRDLNGFIRDFVTPSLHLLAWVGWEFLLFTDRRCPMNKPFLIFEVEHNSNMVLFLAYAIAQLQANSARAEP